MAHSQAFFTSSTVRASVSKITMTSVLYLWQKMAATAEISFVTSFHLPLRIKISDKGEILLTILSSLSQEEARSISENVTWGLRKKFADGKFSVGYSRFLGYDKGENGNLAINEEQAKTVRLIFGLFIEGLTPCAIAKELTRRGILTVTGKSKWNAATINGVLANEKYTGCARIQKTFTPDFLTKKV